jgi:hypothetical protein
LEASLVKAKAQIQTFNHNKFVSQKLKEAVNDKIQLNESIQAKINLLQRKFAS